jgi:hypothetical protein
MTMKRDRLESYMFEEIWGLEIAQSIANAYDW